MINASRTCVTSVGHISVFLFSRLLHYKRHLCTLADESIDRSIINQYINQSIKFVKSNQTNRKYRFDILKIFVFASILTYNENIMKMVFFDTFLIFFSKYRLSSVPPHRGSSNDNEYFYFNPCSRANKEEKIIDTPVKPLFYYMKGGLNYTDVLPLCMATV